MEILYTSSTWNIFLLSVTLHSYKNNFSMFQFTLLFYIGIEEISLYSSFRLMPAWLHQLRHLVSCISGIYNVTSDRSVLLVCRIAWQKTTRETYVHETAVVLIVNTFVKHQHVRYFDLQSPGLNKKKS